VKSIIISLTAILSCDWSRYCREHFGRN